MFIELHAQSAFTFLEGSDPPETFVAEAAKLDMPDALLAAETDLLIEIWRDFVGEGAELEHAGRIVDPRARASTRGRF